MILGIDPGWASCGIAVQEDGRFLRSYHFAPRDYSVNGSVETPIRHLRQQLDDSHDVELDCIREAYIERYVAYKGIHSDMSEAILMFIGALKYWLEQRDIKVHMTRAIDWKPKVCKHLVRTKGFNNPYPSFDKKYSILAATTLSGWEFKTDHEADAVCLSYLGEIAKFDKKNKK
jgi:hypothetical protein